MPALPPVSHVLSVQTIFTVGVDTNVRCKWFFSYSGSPPSPTDANTLATAIYGDVNAGPLQDLSSTYSCTGVEVIDLNSATGASGTALGNKAGLAGANNLPAQSCVLLNASIARRYRGGKPRTYWPLGITSQMATPQTWTTAGIGFFALHLGNYRTFILGQSAGSTVISAHVNVSYYQGFTNVTNPTTGRVTAVPKLRTGGPLVDTITGISVNPKIGTQRRRISA